MIRVKCLGCGQILTVKDDMVGRTGKCPSCLMMLRVPAVSPAPMPQTAPASPAPSPAPVPEPRRVEPPPMPAVKAPVMPNLEIPDVEDLDLPPDPPPPSPPEPALEIPDLAGLEPIPGQQEEPWPSPSPAPDAQEVLDLELVEDEEEAEEVEEVEEIEEIEEVEEIEDVEEIDRYPRQPPPLRRHEDDYDRPRPGRRDRYEDYDRPRRGRRGSYDDDHDDRDRRPRRARPDVSSAVMLGVSALLMLFLGLMTLFPALYQSVTFDPGFQQSVKQLARQLGAGSGSANPSAHVPGSELLDKWEGKVVLILSILVALLLIAAVIVLLAASKRAGDVLVVTSGCVAAGWSLLVLVLFVGYLWLALEMPTVNLLVARASYYPGFALWFGLVLAVGLLPLLMIPVFKRNGGVWMVLALSCGLVFGVLWVVLDVQPWNAPKPLGLPGNPTFF